MINPISSTLATVIFLIGLVYAALTRDYVPFIGCAFIAVIVLYAIRIASEWDRVVILRLGRYNRTVGPGIFLMIPLVDVVADTRRVVTVDQDALGIVEAESGFAVHVGRDAG